LPFSAASECNKATLCGVEHGILALNLFKQQHKIDSFKVPYGVVEANKKKSF
jgi:hypothetical protein